MRPSRPHASLALIAALSTVALCGCTNPDAPTGSPAAIAQSSPASPGEPAPPAPASAGSDAPVDVQPTPQAALWAFAALYFNWSYRSLSRQQRALAAMSVGAARAAEAQAAASSAADTTIGAGHITNSATVETIAREHGGAALWVIVTREQTTGSGSYERLPVSFHVTLARLAAVAGGYAVSEWLPQD